MVCSTCANTRAGSTRARSFSSWRRVTQGREFGSILVKCDASAPLYVSDSALRVHCARSNAPKKLAIRSRTRDADVARHSVQEMHVMHDKGCESTGPNYDGPER